MSRLASVVEYAFPVVLGLAYWLFVVESDVSGIAKALLLVGYAIVVLLWMTARELKLHATINRASAVGEPEEMLRLAEQQLARRRSARRRAPFVIYRAAALGMSGRWSEALTALEDFDLGTLRGRSRQAWQFLYYTNLIAAQCFNDRTGEARRVLDEHLAPLAASLATPGSTLGLRESTAKVQYFEGQLEEARETFEALVNDVRLSEAARGLYQYFLGRIALDGGDRDLAGKRFRRARELAPDTFIPADVDRLVPAP